MGERKIDGSAWIVAYLFIVFILLFGFMVGWIVKGLCL
jgi:hypothetical protein